MTRTLQDVRDDVKARITCQQMFERTDMAELSKSGRGWFKLYESQSKNGLVVWDRSFFDHSSRCHGDVIDIMGYSLDGTNWCNTGDQFIKALKKCAEMTGVEWAHVTQEQKEAAAQQRNLYDWLTKIANFYHGQLTPRWREFLHTRYGLTDETIDNLRIGWATPDWDKLSKWLVQEGLTETQALKTGLVTKAKTGSLVDFYRGRLVFPYWEAGRVVYSIARQTEDTPPWLDKETGKDKTSKYIKQKVHSEKNHWVSKHIRNDYFYHEDASYGVDELYLTEGVTDCILANQEGFSCISPVTVHFRKGDWPRLLKLVRNVKTLYLAFDNEDNEAGARGALDTARHLWEHGHNPLLVTIPRPDGIDKVDLNDFLREQGAGAFDKAIACAQTLVDITIESINDGAPRKQPERIKNELIPLLADVYTDLSYGAYCKQVKTKLGFPLGEIRRFVKLYQQEQEVQQKQSQLKRHLEDNGLPPIPINEHHLPTLTGQAWQAIHKSNGGEPSVFRWGNALCRIELSDYGTPILRGLSVDRVRHLLARIANWYKLDKDGGMNSVYPPEIVVKDLLATPDPTLPILNGVTGSPVFAPDGTLQIIEGYNDRSRLYFAPAPGFNVSEVSLEPNEDQVDRARSLIMDDILGQFPFRGPRNAESERAHAAAIFMQPFMRAMISGATPMYLIEKPTPGTGATLMVQALLYPFLGGLVAATTEGRSEEEWRKRITAKLQDAPACFFIDNLRQRLDSSALATVITSGMWEDRILGVSEMTTIQARCMWVATGNNPAVSQEIKRRCVRVRLDAQQPDPHLRAGFKHPKLLNWVQDNRAELVWAALVLGQNWIAKKMPQAELTLGMFDEWAAVMGGVLTANGIPGFLGNLEDFYKKSDLAADDWIGFISTWWDVHGETPVKAKELESVAVELGLDLGDKGKGLGHRISRCRERQYDIEIIGGKMRVEIAYHGTSQNAVLWQLIGRQNFEGTLEDEPAEDRPFLFPDEA